MSSVRFYDDDWQRLFREYPLVARKLEDLRCEVVSYEEFEKLRKRVDQLEKKASQEVLRISRRETAQSPNRSKTAGGR